MPKTLKQPIGALRASPVTGKSKKPPLAKPPRARPGFLIAAGVALILGAGWLLPGIFSSKPPEAGANSKVLVQPETGQTASAGSPASRSLGSGTSAGSSFAPSRRPNDFLASFFPEGRMPQFTRADELSPRDDGQPMVVYCLLYSLLDDYTQRMWQRAGLFRDEHIMLSPFLRTVTIRDKAALNYLIDWHVESVALSLPNSAGAKQ